MAKIPHVARYLTGNRSQMTDAPAPANPVTTPIKVGDFIRITADLVELVAGADPTNILGIAKSHNGSVARQEAVDPTRILFEILGDDVCLWMEGTRAPLATDKFKSYGIVIDGGAGMTHYKLDLTDTTATRMYVQDVDLTRNAYFCILLPLHRQQLPDLIV